MVLAPEYPLETQAKFIPAMCAIHNFIRIYDPQDYDQFAAQEHNMGPAQRFIPPAENLGGYIDAAESSRATEKREEIAKAMWVSYQRILEERGEN